MPIQTLSLKNYGVFRSAEFLGLSPLTIVVGANGTGKSTLFDVFSFLKDALRQDVHAAVAERGGFQELVSRGQRGPIEVVVGYSGADERLLVYGLSLAEHEGRVVVDAEHLRCQERSSERFMDFKRGEGTAIRTPCIETGEAPETVGHALNGPSTLAIGALGLFSDYSLIAEVRSLIENWHLSDLQASDLRSSIPAGHAEHLSATGDNAAQFAARLHERHPEQLRDVLQAMRHHVPGVDGVEVRTTEDNRLLLRFKDGNIEQPFAAKRVSEGTLKLFAYLLLLHDPKPHPLLAVEEPENHLYPDLLGHLAEELQCYARRGGQALVATHSPELLDAARLDEIFWLEKAKGFSEVRRAIDSPVLRRLVEEGELPGSLWMQRLFEGAHPR